MFNWVAKLACFRYFLGCLRLFLTETRGVNSIKNAAAADIFIGGIFA